MTIEALLRNNQLDEAVSRLTAQVRDNPLDLRSRTSLFELLCFVGDYPRAEKQLDVLAGAGPQTEMGAMLYRGILWAERTRQEMFEKGSCPKTNPSEKNATIVGSVNGRRFTSLYDGDPRIGSNLELFSAGSYVWIPFAMIESITMQPPKRLRDLLWRPAVVRTSAAFKGQEIGEAFVPVLCPGTHKEADPQARLGRVTSWVEDAEGQAIPVGQKMLVIDEEEIPILEISELQFQLAQTAP
jgi:type VI secretion system protein ImpE